MVPSEQQALRIFLCGDVMTGRGIDQVLPHPTSPELYEGVVTDARQYVALAEQASGPIPRSVVFPYIWGDALAEMEERRLHARVINLETAVTTSPDPYPKGINYRMNPLNAGCLSAARFDCCVLANNHVLDWGASGLRQTLETLHEAGIRTAGAGRDLEEARRPAIIEAQPDGRIAVFGVGFPTSGIPDSWAASPHGAGINFIGKPSAKVAGDISAHLRSVRSSGTIVIVSIHWGENWGYHIPAPQVEFAHALIDSGAADVVHGHSSHHAKAIEVYKGRLVLYGCGDFLTDYEGIGGHERFRPDLSLAYFATVEPSSGMLRKLEIVPFRERRFRLEKASNQDAEWIHATLTREGKRFGTQVRRKERGALSIAPDAT